MTSLGRHNGLHKNIHLPLIMNIHLPLHELGQGICSYSVSYNVSVLPIGRFALDSIIFVLGTSLLVVG